MLTQIINKDNKPVPVKLVGDGTDAAQINIGTFETDSDGKQVLRIIDAAPFAYDALDDALKMKIVKDAQKIVRNKYEINIAANSSDNVEINMDVSEFSKISWGVSTDSSHSFTLETMLQDFDDVKVMHPSDRADKGYIKKFTGSNGLTSELTIQTTGIRLMITNQDVEKAHTYSVYVYLRR